MDGVQPSNNMNNHTAEGWRIIIDITVMKESLHPMGRETRKELYFAE